jgi:hypothetical protein
MGLRIEEGCADFNLAADAVKAAAKTAARRMKSGSLAVTLTRRSVYRGGQKKNGHYVGTWGKKWLLRYWPQVR